MDVVKITPSVTAVLRPADGANVGLIDTGEGLIVIDTAQSATEAAQVLGTAGAAPQQAVLLINTHCHSDHTWGNQLFDCPILAHRLCRQMMTDCLTGRWSAESIEQGLAECDDPAWAARMRQEWSDLQITLPTETFDRQRTVEIGSAVLELVHLGGHTPGSSVAWLPESGTLFTGDLIFQHQYPYLQDADVPVWIAALEYMLTLPAQTIVPGHGTLCDEARVVELADYLAETWSRTADHVARGHDKEETLADPDYPRYAEDPPGRFEENIRLVYARLKNATHPEVQ